MACGIDGATRIGKGVKPEELWPSLSLLAGFENRYRHGSQSISLYFFCLRFQDFASWNLLIHKEREREREREEEEGDREKEVMVSPMVCWRFQMFVAEPLRAHGLLFTQMPLSVEVFTIQPGIRLWAEVAYLRRQFCFAWHGRVGVKVYICLLDTNVKVIFEEIILKLLFLKINLKFTLKLFSKKDNVNILKSVFFKRWFLNLKIFFQLL